MAKQNRGEIRKTRSPRLYFDTIILDGESYFSLFILNLLA